ncbi:MAG: chitobiase/beta-hexosaminidase C-terminal domain-containing protein [Bacteroidales bacterium]|nr:chitobiase/beta-hexosaminidase C-terminal domain-containing protein [Bacteroidales bacterium]
MKRTLSTTLIIVLSAIFIFTSCKKDDDTKPTVSNPTFTMPAGIYDNDISVGMACATDGASIYYTIDGSTPSSSSTKFTSNITISETTTLKAVSCKDGYNNSGIVEATYIIEKQAGQVETPKIKPGSCTFSESILVSISCATQGTTIRYTLDGSEPNASSEEYVLPLTLKETTTVKAKAFVEEILSSETAVATFTKESAGIHTPEFVYPGGTFVGSKVIAIRCTTEGAAIYYTTDGSTPTSSSTQYTTSFKITESATIKAIAYKDGLGYSDVAEEHYEIVSETVANPTFSISGGTFDEPIKNLVLSCATEGAAIHFTLNGSEPTELSPVYSQPLSFSETTTIKARAFKNEYEPSDIVEQTYIIEISADGLITVVNSTGTHEFIIDYVTKKSSNTLLIKTEEGNEMTLDFEHLETGTFNFPTYENDPSATCTGTLVYPHTTLKFINGGEISVIQNGNNYTLTIDNVEATDANTLIPVIQHVSLSFTGTIL